MNPEIAKLIAALNARVADLEKDYMDRYLSTEDEQNMERAAVILQAVFDPENQPSQFRTVLTKPQV